ncbi:DUF7282 domain-containing protein [Natronococcus occultus]|uniref:Cell surface protein possibly involved in adhesion with CARDB domain n=1 Tax=Natronococcus occultus SP4 TaxID=694430 RepID=L0K529_9EURY|nr:CARDB domain-containing protein [Natronococcus occultus]AGB39660.1 cell surface protein possibly involved in adhesion with CARDB domain [Natronococcus occultus SP4]
MSSRATFGTIKRVTAILIAIAVVLAAGIVVGQAPVIFGVDEDPSASISFEDQENDGVSVGIDEVTLSDGGFVVITDGGDEPLAVSTYLEDGTHENVTVESEDNETELAGQLTATVHQDTTGDETFQYYETDGEEDQPYLEDGYPVSDTASVTLDEDEAVSDSFVVESMTAPESATTNETISVTAEVRNPTEFAQQQIVEFRLNGTVLERQILELDGGEDREVTFEVDTSGTPPGTQAIGVYTDDDGEIGEIELEFHTDPSISVVDADTDEVTVDVATPEDGFVAVEDDDELLGTSDELEAGEHENVTVEFDENASVEDDDELTAVVYEGDPDDVDDAEPLEHDDEPVEATFSIADIEAEDESDDEDDDAGDDDE